MTTYVLRRLVLMVPVAFLVTVGVFMLIHLSPGDPALIILGEDRNPQAIAAIHQQLGLDKPLYVQYVIWLGHIVHGDLGRSITTHQPVTIAIGERLPATAELGAVALHLARAGVEQQSANRRAADIDTDDKGIRAHGEFPL